MDQMNILNDLRYQINALREQNIALKERLIYAEEKIARLEQLESSEINELSAALAKAQAEFTVAGKSRENPFFKSSYADLEDLAAATRPALTKHGLSVHTRIVTQNDRQYARIILRHSSGQFTTSESIVNPTKPDPQSEGSCRSYKVRYGYREITGVVVSEDQEDDDAEKVMNRSTHSVPSSNYITQEQVDLLELELKGDNDLKYDMLSKLEIESIQKIPKARFMNILSRVREIKSLQERTAKK